MNAIPRLRAYEGPAILSYGFRPFFLLGGLYAGLAIVAWLPMFFGAIAFETAFVPLDWHVHEMLYGYLAAVVAGFLLTAVPNWTGRLPLQGTPLLLLVIAWLAGRVAVTASATIGWAAAMAVDLAFLALLGAAAAREVIAGQNWRNLKVLVPIGIFTVGNLVFHLEAHFQGKADVGIRLGIAAGVTLIMLIGGRIVPSFTRNWLARQGEGRLPAPFGRFDGAAIAVSVLGLCLWVARPEGVLTGGALLVAAVLQAARLARWAGDRTAGERLVLILHVGYAFVPLGFALSGMTALGLVPASAGIHAWTGGAVGTMTLAVMTRATLGHTGRALVAGRATEVLYAAIVAGALARICAALEPAWSGLLLAVAALAWATAFLGFAAIYGPMLAGRRRQT